MARKYPSVTAALKEIDKRIRQGVIEDTRVVANRQAARLNNVTRKWKNKVAFKREEKQERGETRQQIVAEGTDKALEIFGYVDEGTEAHLIFPKKEGGVLAFKSKYSARTAPIANENAGTGKSSGKTKFSKGVLHPGNEAREFTAYAQLQAEVELEERIEQRINRIAAE